MYNLIIWLRVVFIRIPKEIKYWFTQLYMDEKLRF
jgi:hypothetical protein